MKTGKQGISFSIEVARSQIKRVSLPEGSGDCLMVEGFLGDLMEMKLIEDILLEIKGSHGVLRIGLPREGLEKALKGKNTKSE